MEVAKITGELAQQIAGIFIESSVNWNFNPVQDCNGNWIISLPEATSALQEGQYEIISWSPPVIEDE